MEQAGSDGRQAIMEAVAAATIAANEWLSARGSVLTLSVESSSTVRSAVNRFLHGASARKVDWDWEQIFHKKVKFKCAWLFSLRRGEQPVALCMGSVSVVDDHVALEYLERRPRARGVRGVPLAVAFQFALAVANALGLRQVRINNPLNPRLTRYYARFLGMTPVRLGTGPGVNYLYRNTDS